LPAKAELRAKLGSGAFYIRQFVILKIGGVKIPKVLSSMLLPFSPNLAKKG